jgi:hypothetical protein
MRFKRNPQGKAAVKPLLAPDVTLPYGVSVTTGQNSSSTDLLASFACPSGKPCLTFPT